MVKNHTCKFLVSKSQLDQIRSEAKAKGYINISPYLRDLALKYNLTIEQKIIETHLIAKKIMELLE